MRANCCEYEGIGGGDRNWVGVLDVVCLVASVKTLLIGSAIGIAFGIGYLQGFLNGFDDSEQVVHTTVWPCEIERGDSI